MSSLKKGEEDMALFVKYLFERSEDYGSLTVKQIRTAYLKKANLKTLDADQRMALKSIVCQEFSKCSQLQNRVLKGPTSEDLLVPTDDKIPVEKDASILKTNLTSKNSLISSENAESRDVSQTRESSIMKEDNENQSPLNPDPSSKISAKNGDEDCNSVISTSSADSVPNLEKKEPKFAVKKNKTSAKHLNTEDLCELLSCDDSGSDVNDEMCSSESDHSEPKKATSSEGSSLAKKKRKIQSSNNSDSEVEFPVTKKSKTVVVSSESSNSESEEELSDRKSKKKMKTHCNSRDVQNTVKCNVVLKLMNLKKDSTNIYGEPLRTKTGRKGTKKVQKVLASSDSEEEPVSAKKFRKGTKKNQKNLVSSDSEDEPIVKKVENNPVPSDSEDEPLMKPVQKNLAHSDSEDEPLVKNVQKNLAESGSEDEPLIKQKRTTSSEENEENSPDTGLKKKNKTSQKGKEGKQSKKLLNVENVPSKKSSKTSEEPVKKATKKVEVASNLKHLRSCCHAAGLFIRYDKVFDQDDTDDMKELTLLKLLKDAGLKGKPTMEACKRLKLRREDKKALEELDLSNIINDSGRGRRQNVYSAYQSASTVIVPSVAKVTEHKKAYSRLKGIVDSEESDSD